MDALVQYLAEGKDPSAAAGLNADLASRLVALLGQAPAPVRIVSGYRTPERQAQILAENMGKYGLGGQQGAWLADVQAMGPQAAGEKWRPIFRDAGVTKFIAMPNYSQHQKGSAVDLSYASEAAKQWVHDNAAQFGLHFPMAHEDWHIEALGGPAGGSAPVGTPPALSGGNPIAAALARAFGGAARTPAQAPTPRPAPDPAANVAAVDPTRMATLIAEMQQAVSRPQRQG